VHNNNTMLVLLSSGKVCSDVDASHRSGGTSSPTNGVDRCAIVEPDYVPQPSFGRPA
jgi:hypothetical protein